MLCGIRFCTAREKRHGEAQYRDGILKLIRSPGIDLKESISAYVGSVENARSRRDTLQDG